MNKEILKKQGVYAIRNIVNGKVYIGSTTNSFRERWRTHRKKLKGNKHPNNYLQNSWNKYGKDCFIFEILEITEPENCLKREGYYIKLYKALNRQYGYNVQDVDINGNRSFTEETVERIRQAAKENWEKGLLHGNFKKGLPSWNKGLKCPQISLARRNMFSSVQVYKDDMLVVTFRSVADLEDWTKENELPGLTYYTDKHNRPNIGYRTTHIRAANIQRAIRTNAKYRGLYFKRSMPLPPEMGVAKWENCWKGEIPNQQPSQQLTELEGSETNG